MQQTGQRTQAHEAALAAATNARNITGKQDQVAALSKVACVLHLMGETEQGRHAINLAISTASELSQHHLRAIAFSQIANTLAAIGQRIKTEEFAVAARDEARLVKKPQTAVDCLAQVAMALAVVDRRGDGLSEVDHALELASSVKYDPEKAHAWSMLALALVALDEAERGSELASAA